MSIAILFTFAPYAQGQDEQRATAGLSPSDVSATWNEALARGDVETAAELTSKTSETYIQQAFGSLEQLSAVMQRELRGVKLRRKLVHQEISGNSAVVVYRMEYDADAITYWMDKLVHEEGSWKVAPQHTQMLPLNEKVSYGNVKAQELETLPVGLEVRHTPNPVKAMKEGPSKRSFTWVYETEIRSSGGSVKIEEFGSLYRHGDAWVFSTTTGKPFTAEDFAEWYSCPEGLIRPNQKCTDPSNWSGNDDLSAQIVKWYYIGTDEKGRRVKGEAIVEELPELTSQ